MVRIINEAMSCAVLPHHYNQREEHSKNSAYTIQEEIDLVAARGTMAGQKQGGHEGDSLKPEDNITLNNSVSYEDTKGVNLI